MTDVVRCKYKKGSVDLTLTTICTYSIASTLHWHIKIKGWGFFWPWAHPVNDVVHCHLGSLCWGTSFNLIVSGQDGRVSGSETADGACGPLVILGVL